jgi:hypothetical protein
MTRPELRTMSTHALGQILTDVARFPEADNIEIVDCDGMSWNVTPSELRDEYHRRIGAVA